MLTVLEIAPLRNGCAAAIMLQMTQIAERNAARDSA